MTAHTVMGIGRLPADGVAPKRFITDVGHEPRTAFVLALQRSAGNEAVARHLASRSPEPVHLGSLGPVVAQRCGPTPCNCSTEERTEYAANHPAAQTTDNTERSHDIAL